MVVEDVLLELYLRFAFLLTDLARITFIYLDPNPLSIFASANFQMLLGVPCRLKLFIALRALLVLSCVQQRIFLALVSQHFLKFLGPVGVIRLF